MPFASGPILTYIGGGQYATVGPTLYVGSDDLIEIADGFHTDLASVPRIFWALLPPSGVYEKAAVLHDFLCVQLGTDCCTIPSVDVDGLFRRVAREGGAGFLTRWALWTGVRWGALFNRHRRAGWLPSGLGVIAITAVGLAVVCGLLLGLHLAVDWLLHIL
jgi:hypothetical protein